MCAFPDRARRLGALVVACAALLPSCARYYVMEATLPASAEATADAFTHAAGNIPDFSVIDDAVHGDSVEMRFLGLQGATTLSGRDVHSVARFGVRVTPQGDKAEMTVSSVGNEQFGKMVLVATEQELQHRALARGDSTGAAPPGALRAKSSALHQILNFVSPAAGMIYTGMENPYVRPRNTLDAIGVQIIDLAALGSIVGYAHGALGPDPQRHAQYKFLIGAIVAGILRYTWGTEGFLRIEQFNALVDSPYNLESSFLDRRAATIGLTVRFP